MPRQNKGPYLKLDKGTGVWKVHWTEPGGQGRRVSTGTRDRTEATRYLANFILEGQQAHAEAVKQAAKDDELTVDTILDWYQTEHVENDLSEVVEDGRKTLRIHLRWLRAHFGPLRLSEVNDDSVRDYVAKRAAGMVTGGVKSGPRGERKAKSPGTMRRELGTLIAAFAHAVEDHKPPLPKACVPFVRMPPKPDAKNFWLRESESPQLMQAAIEYGNLRGRLFVAIAMHTASRKAAIEQLTWDQIDFDAILDDDGDAQGIIHFNPQGRRQTKKRRVPTPICPELRAELELIPVKDRHGYVLPRTRKNGRGDITSVFRKVVAFAAKKYDNPRFLQATPHSLRHTWATQAVRAGFPMEKVAAFLGDELKTVTENYIHHSPGYLRDVANFRSLTAKRKAKKGNTDAPLSIPELERLLARLKAEAAEPKVPV